MGTVILIVIAGAIFFLLFPELTLFYFVAIGMGAVYATALNSFYDKHSYYQKKGFWLENFGFATFVAVIAIPIGIIFLAHGWSNFVGGLTTLPVMIIFLVAYYISKTRRAAAEDKAMNEALAKLLEASKMYSSYASWVIYYVEVEKRGSSFEAYIYAQVATSNNSNPDRIEKICPGGTPDLERFLSYAKANHIGQVSGNEKSVSIRFPQNW